MFRSREPWKDKLRVQIGVGVQLVVLEDVAGLDRLHQAQVVRVDDGGGQTLHHGHGDERRVHDRADVLRRTVGVVGQTAGGLQAFVREQLDGVQNVHLLVLHALDDEEQRVEPEVGCFHAQRQTTLEHMMAVHHALFVVLCDAVGRAQRDADGVVGRSQIDIGDTGACVSGVDDGLAVRAVVDLDAGLDGALVGGIERQRHVVEVLLQQLDCPGHQLRTVGLGRTDVDIQIRCASLDLLCGTLEDGIGVERCHSLADHRGDAVDTLADGDELRGLRITLLVAHTHVDDLDGRDGRSDLLEIERRVGVGSFLLLRGGSLGGSGSLGGLDVFAVAQVLDQLDRLTGADDDVPLRQLVLDLALHDGNLARDDEGTVVDLVCQIELIEEGKKVIQETRRWDDNKEYSYAMRSKEDAQDYRYFPEPDLVPIVISDEWIQKIKDKQPELRSEKLARYEKDYDIPRYDAELITGTKKMADLFEATCAICNKPKKVSNWLMVETMRLLNENGQEPADIKFSPENLAKLIELADAGTINSSVAKEVFERVFAEDVDPEKYVEDHGLKTVNDEGALRTLAEEVIAKNPKAVEDFKGGKEKALGALVGQIMKAMKGKANPGMVNELLREMLK